MASAVEELSLSPQVRHLHRALSFKMGPEGQWTPRIIVLTSRGRGPRAVGSRWPRVTLVQRRSCVPIPGATAGLSPGGSWMAALAGCRHLGPQPGSCVTSACLFLTPPGPSPHRILPHRSKHPGPWLVTRGAGSSLAMPLPAGGPQAPLSGNPLGTQCLFWSFSQVASDEP